MEELYEVKLHVYDVTKGLARQLSPMLLGKQIDGVWHTGVFVYGQEYFFGSGGIAHCSPCGTILGQPDQVIDMGRTQVTKDLFEEYLQGLESSDFSGSSYHLLEHNCNNFSSEITQFLTGSPIPAHITNLPGDVMGTPFGAAIRPFIEAFTSASRVVSFGDLPQPYVHGGATASPQSGVAVSKDIAASNSAHGEAAALSKSNTRPDTRRRLRSLPSQPAESTRQELLETLECVLEDAGELDLPADLQKTLTKLGDAVRSESSQWPQPGNGWTLKGAVRLVGHVMTRATIPTKTPDPADRLRLQIPGMQILSVVLAVPGAVKHYITPQHLLMRLLNACIPGSKNSLELQQAVLAMVAQLTTSVDGRRYVVSNESWALSQEQTTNTKLCVPLVVEGVLSNDAKCQHLALRALHNISLVESLASSVQLECGTAVAEAAQHIQGGASQEEATELALLSLARFSAYCEDLQSLLPALDLKLNVDGGSEGVQEACKLLNELIPAES